MRLFRGREAVGERALLRRLLVRITGGALALGLVLLHLRLLWQRLSDQSVLEPVVAAKWLATVILLAALWRLRARGYRLLTGRPAGIIWLLALLLHIQAPVVPASQMTGPVDIGWLFALPATVSVGAVVAITLGVALASLLGSSVRPPVAVLRLRTRRRGGPVMGSLAAIACRPPPALL